MNSRNIHPVRGKSLLGTTGLRYQNKLGPVGAASLRGLSRKHTALYRVLDLTPTLHALDEACNGENPPESRSERHHNRGKKKERALTSSTSGETSRGSRGDACPQTAGKLARRGSQDVRSCRTRKEEKLRFRALQRTEGSAPRIEEDRKAHL